MMRLLRPAGRLHLGRGIAIGTLVTLAGLAWACGSGSNAPAQDAGGAEAGDDSAILPMPEASLDASADALAMQACTASPCVTGLRAGGTHTCAQIADGTLRCWMPTRVAGLPGPAAAVASGYLHTCALLVGGGVECWGSNQFGELGQGPAEAGAPDSLPHPSPLPVAP